MISRRFIRPTQSIPSPKRCSSSSARAFYRVSTEKPCRSGLGLEAQRKAVEDYLNGGNWHIVAEVVEIESGKRNDRPKLAEALRLCRLHGAALIIAKLDRLARNVDLLSALTLVAGGAVLTAFA